MNQEIKYYLVILFAFGISAIIFQSFFVPVIEINSWKPDFVDVSSSGDLGYTYGQYTFIRLDSIGNETASQGIFHTVWKRQSDGNWRFVYD